MKHRNRQYPSYDIAVAELTKLGEVKFWGTVAVTHDIYTLTIKGVIYRLFVYQSGLVEWREEL